jgi:pimeloyl-ACP methyl ester carboxylesterase
MTTYVLVPGFWLGGWAWRPVTTALREQGHEVYPVTLTGLGERVHLARPDTDLEVHVDDVANLLTYEDLHDVVLVGHSYAGLVITGVADRLPERVARLVYVDTGPLPDGASQNDFNPPDARAANAAALEKEGDGWLLPPPSWADLAEGVPDVDDSALDALTRRSVPQPWASAIAPARLTGAWERLPRLGILCSFTEVQTRAMAASAPLFRHMAGDGWRFVELPTWHWPMFTRPSELAAIISG